MSSTPPEDPGQSPYGQQPAGPPPHGQQPPGQPPYGQAPPPPHQPYGQPFPGGDPRQERPPSKAMAVWSLVLSLLICLPVLAPLVSITLGIVVLVRSKDGRAHGRGLAIAGIVISSLVLVATAVGLVALVVYGVNSLKDVNDLQRGDCISAEDLTDTEAEGLGLLTIDECTDEHDAEVVATLTLDSEDAEAFPGAQGTAICQNLVLDDPDLSDLLTPGRELLTITDSAEPEAGDTVACVVFNEDGSKLDAPLQ